MPKNIVVLIDGTGNEIEADESSVLRLAHMLVNDRARQVFYYDPGVGTQGAPATDLMSRQELIKLLGLGIGTGVYEKIGNAYRFVVDAYEAGDQLFLFGFSRGAYIARALAGLIGKIGILQRGRDNLVPYVVKLYADPRNLTLTRSFSETFCDREAEIAFLGLWDTVKSVFRFEPRGPELTSVVLPRTFANPAVRIVRHAVALDERRRFYRTNLWSEDREARANTDVKQVWFAGVHSDIGGGYPTTDSGLAHPPLSWILREAKLQGLEIDSACEQLILTALEQATNTLHRSLGGWWWWPEVVPKLSRCGPTGKRRAALYIPFGEARFVPDGAFLHQSVVDRVNAGIGYSPRNLPARYSVAS
jgi:uncharacterized protein (DUF2235 family)